MRLPEIPLQIAPGILKKKYENSYFFVVFFWYFRGILSIPCRRGNLSVGLVFLAYFGVCGVFCSVAGSWVVKAQVAACAWAASASFRRAQVSTNFLSAKLGFTLCPYLQQDMSRKSHPTKKKIPSKNKIISSLFLFTGLWGFLLQAFVSIPQWAPRRSLPFLEMLQSQGPFILGGRSDFFFFCSGEGKGESEGPGGGGRFFMENPQEWGVFPAGEGGGRGPGGCLRGIGG